ncbi:MAG: hypothetical protein HZA50_01140 [Planctomycetes bacterium]|nr:hypothetical protein [Planctomycetota bacterium]
MNFTSIKIAGADAIRILNDYRSKYATTGQYPFLIGDHQELERVQENAEFNKQYPTDIIQTSLGINIAEWIAERRKKAEEYEFSPGEMLGEWPDEDVREKGSIILHKDICSGKIKKEKGG